MESHLTTLTSADLQRFERDGYVVVRQAFRRADALAMERQWWRELEDAHGIRRDDRSTWRQIPGNLKAAKRDPAQASILTESVCGFFDDLLGTGTWPQPKDWGRTIVTFPEAGSWELPSVRRNAEPGSSPSPGPLIYLHSKLFWKQTEDSTMPHVTVRMPEDHLVGREPALITALSEAVVQVYGEWARDLVVVHLDGVPKGRWGIGGKAVDDAAPAITFGIREAALARPDGSQIAARLVAGLTDAVASVLGEQARGGTSVELVASPEGRTGIGGAIAGLLVGVQVRAEAAPGARPGDGLDGAGNAVAPEQQAR